MPSIRHSPWRRPWRRAAKMAKSIFAPTTHEIFWYQNGQPMGRLDAGWWAPSKWPWAQKVGSDDVTFHQYPGSYLLSLILEPRSRFPAVLVAGAACYQYWPCRGLCWLVPSGRCPKIDVAAVDFEFRRWGSDVGAISWPTRIDLIKWYLLVRTASNEEFKCFQPKAFPLHFCFFEENKTVHLQHHLPCPGNNLFQNNTVKVLGPTKLDENSGFLFSWSDKDCYDRWAQASRACNLLGSVAMFWRLQWLLKAHHREFCIEFWPESFFENSRPPGAIGPSR